MNKDTVLYLSSITYNYHQEEFWESLRPECKEGGRFFLDLSQAYRPQRFVSRNGEWSLPWPQQIPPEFVMPDYDPKFNMSFNDASDERALEIGNCISEKNQKFAVMYSGGIDSTVIMSALIKNLTAEQLKNVVVCANAHSMIENPMFWKKFVWGKFDILDSSKYKYDDLIEKGYRPITADEGDCIFGTMSFLDLHQNYEYFVSKIPSAESRARLSSMKYRMTDGDIHYSRFKDVIMQYWNIPTNDRLGIDWYEKFDKNINTATVPINSVQDYFWWVLFNIKWVSCAIRIPVYLNDRLDCKTVIQDWAVNWFNSVNYQKWSMVNNNNGEKIEYTGTTYKMAARRYIHDLDKNDWYFYFKLKLGSLGPNVMYRQDVSKLSKEMIPNARFGIDSNYKLLSVDDPGVKNYIKDHLTSFEKNW